MDGWMMISISSGASKTSHRLIPNGWMNDWSWLRYVWWKSQSSWGCYCYCFFFNFLIFWFKKIKLKKIKNPGQTSLITIEVHARDVIEKLIRVACNSPESFEWSSQLRFYWENDTCTIKQVSGAKLNSTKLN
jgi:hypothetical protein